jgi:hypothetical protein
MKLTKAKLKRIIKEELEATLLENRRIYQNGLLTEGKILDVLKNGFKKLISAPKQFDQMVQQTQQNFADNIAGNIEQWAASPEMQAVVQEIEAAGRQRGGLQEADAGTCYTVDDLREMGVGPETIGLIRMSTAETVAETLVAAAEEAVGKAAPPAIKDWLLRFVSKFVGSFVFGFIDNFIMVVAGSQIDAQIGGLVGGAPETSSADLAALAQYAALAQCGEIGGLVGGAAVAAGSTINAGMLAAGLGNTLSDAIGEMASNTIESVMEKAGLDPQVVTDEEVASGPAWMRFLDKQAGVIGIILGCLAGLFPLFLEEGVEQDETNKRINKMKLTKARLKRIIKEELEETMDTKQKAAEQIAAAVENALKSKMGNDEIRDAVEDSLPEDNWRGNKNPLR